MSREAARVASRRASGNARFCERAFHLVGLLLRSSGRSLIHVFLHAGFVVGLDLLQLACWSGVSSWYIWL